jgi:hypothetical protein
MHSQKPQSPQHQIPQQVSSDTQCQMSPDVTADVNRRDNDAETHFSKSGSSPGNVGNGFAFSGGSPGIGSGFSFSGNSPTIPSSFSFLCVVLTRQFLSEKFRAVKPTRPIGVRVSGHSFGRCL